jgi:arginine decarboxylase
MEMLYDKLLRYNDEGIYPFHMPGHKRNIENINFVNPFKIDITEIEGFDNLHNPKDLLADLMKEAADIYGTKKTYYLVNGSTCGILSAIAAVADMGEKILIARNCHKSVYNAIYLGGLNSLYIYPDTIQEFGINGCIHPEEIDDILTENKDIKAVLITSPTYEGIVSDVKAISEITHGHGVPLIIDEAHGAHFGMHKELPESSIKLGADIIIQSLHKTMPSLTQTALLHVNSDKISLSKLERFLSIYQSSSPSYVLMASIDSCIHYMHSKGYKKFSEYMDVLLKYRKRFKDLKNIRLLDYPGSDRTKIILSVKGTTYTGKQLYDELLYRHGIQTEMASADYVIALSSCFDTEKGFRKLYEALKEIDSSLDFYKKTNKVKLDSQYVRTEKKYSITRAMELETEKCPVENAVGKVSAEYMYLYPPGIPIVVPGEIITEEIVRLCRNYEKSGLDIHGIESGSLDNIKIIEE